MKQFLIKARIKAAPKGPDRIRNHIFASNEVVARNKFREIFDDPNNINWEEITFQSIKEIAI